MFKIVLGGCYISSWFSEYDYLTHIINQTNKDLKKKIREQKKAIRLIKEIDAMILKEKKYNNNI